MKDKGELQYQRKGQDRRVEGKIRGNFIIRGKGMTGVWRER